MTTDAATPSRSTAQAHLRGLVENMGFEVMPFKGIEGKVLASVPKDVPLSVTTTEAKGIERTLEVAIHLHENGYAVAPHLAARQFIDRAHVERVVGELASAGIDHIFVVGGDVPEPKGEYTEALHLLRAIGETGHRFVQVGVGSYPEGHPLVSDATLKDVLVEKATIADNTVTQMCFDPTVITDWWAGLAAAGAGNLKLRVGLPGPINRQKLIRVSAGIGLGQSARFLQKQNGLWRFFLPGAYNPTKLVKKLAKAQVGAPAPAWGLHIYTFNEVQGATEWRAKLRREVGLS